MELVTVLAELVADRCQRPVADLDHDRPLFEFGLSSVDAVEMAGILEERVGRPLPPTLVWEHPTINALALALSSAAAEEAAPAVAVADRAAGEAVAIVGIGCRFPGGADHPDALWRLLTEGRDAIGAVPPERWHAFRAAGRSTGGAARWGGFLDDVAGFDAEFFGITAGEARLMDPQQRLLLEVTWEALQHAAIAPGRLAGTRTGVYVGICASEYAHLTTATLEAVEGWTATGGALSIAANRLSYLLDLRGPSMAVDSACSSSLVATHLAVRSLRSGETDCALVGGVNLLLLPALTVAFGQGGGLAPGGRCRPFDAAAEGIVRAEGCGMIVLKRLSDAERDGDRVLALIRGSAVNSDGRSGALVAPNPKAQEQVLREAYADAGLDPSAVDYVEAHGTGTPLGDPIEAGALGAVCGAGRRPGDPLLIGSIKSNLGHLEAAAGVAGVIKAALVLRHGLVPPSLHFEQPSPHIPFTDWGLRVPTVPQPLARRGRPARAGVSAFGFGGTNAHVVLEAAPAGVPSEPQGGTAYCVVTDLSEARVRAAARALARDLPAGTPADVATTLARRGARGPARAVVVAADRDTLRAGLSAVAAGEPHPHAVTGNDGRAAGGGVWVFSGYGGHWPAMGRDLLARERAFADAVDELEPAFEAETGTSLRAGLTSDDAHTAILAQPLTFGLQVALAALWRSYGATPAAVIGHSMGEVAAAVVSGALTPASGMRVIARRAELLARLGPGAMSVLGIGEDEFDAFAADLSNVHIAVVSSPQQIVVTGDPIDVQALAARVAAEARMARTLTTEGAGHSPAVDPLLPPLAEALADLRPVRPAIPFYSTVVDDPRAVPPLSAPYWTANLRRPVHLARAIAAAASDGHRFFLEISPHPVLVRPVRATLEARGIPDALVIGTLRRDGGALSFARQLATVYAHGLPAQPLARGVVLDLPAAPWHRRRHWYDKAGNDAPPALRGLLGLTWAETALPAGTETSAPTGDAAPARQPLPASVPAPAVPGPVHLFAAAADGAEPARVADPPVEGAPPGDDHFAVVVDPGGAPGPARSREALVAVALRGAPDDPLVRAAGGPVEAVARGADAVVVLPAGGDAPDPAAAEALAFDVTRAANAALNGGARRLWLVTRGAATLPTGAAGHADLAWVRGAVRSLAIEQPRLRATWLDLDPADEPGEQAAALRAELAADAADDEVAWRAGQRYAARLRAAAAPPRRPAPVVRPGAAYLLTGGYRGVGLRVARWLAERGAARLVLTGRHGPPRASHGELAELRALGADVRVVCGDLAAPGAAEAAVAAARTGGLRLAGVVHGAGVLVDGLVTDVRAPDVSRVWSPKASGAWRLDAAVRAAGAAGELDWWVSLSSAAALLGSPGQSVYAGANAWLDGFAAWQRDNGIPAIALHYGAWARVGGAAAVRMPGLRAIEPDGAVAALEELLSREPGATGVVPLDIAAAAAAFPEIARLPFFTDLLAAATPVAAAGSAEVAGPAGADLPARGGPDEVPTPDRLRNLPSRQAVRLVGDQIGARIAAVLGASGPPGRDTPLADLGLDSLAAIRIKNLVERDFGVAVPTAVLVRGVTLGDLERSVAAELGIRTNGAQVINGAHVTLPETAVEGRDAAERLVLHVVREVLGPVPCGVTDRLDRIAPPDALARVTALLRQRTGVDVGAVVLAAAPTAERLAAPLRAADEAEVRRGLVRELRPGTAGAPPLFLAHPAGGTTVVYRQLVDLLGPDQPCYGLERLDDVGPVEERAARYLELLAGTQPAGPYRLGGWSFGGVLAFEMARQLTAAGERVELLGLIDAGLPLPVSRRRDTELLVRRFVGFGAYLRQTYGIQVHLSAEELRELPEDGQFDLVLARLADSGLSARLPEAIMRHQITSHRDTRALDRYEPGEYTGPVVLYRCTEATPWNVRDPRYEHTDLDRGFGRWCTDLRVVPVTAHHLNVLDPPAVDAVAADLTALLSATVLPGKE